MALALKVKKENAEKAKNKIKEKNLNETRFKVKQEGQHIYFPLKEKIETDIGKITKTKLEKRKKPPTPSDLLKEKLDKKQIEKLPSSYDIIGDIIILKLPEELITHKNKIGKAYLECNPGINTVVNQTEIHSGTYRTRNTEVIAGENKKETIHTESGLKFKVDIDKVYFSPRLSSERLRIAEKVEEKEKVLVMFSGCAPYCCVISKHSKPKKVYGIEINPKGHRYAQENIKINSMTSKIKLYQGDVKEVLPEIKEKFDRIIMPLPKTASDYLPLAIKKATNHATIHYYTFLEKEEIPQKGEKEIKKACKKQEVTYNIEEWNKAGQSAPYTWRVVYDTKIFK